MGSCSNYTKIAGGSHRPSQVLYDSAVDIVLICKVVDNFGDIGLVYRLARSLSELPEAPSLRLIVDDLRSFKALAPEIDSEAAFQRFRGWEVYRCDQDSQASDSQSSDPEASEASRIALRHFRETPARFVLECFACGRPDWLEAILFEEGQGGSLILDLEYLTAEAYAEELHLMPSLTRSSQVRKLNFLPGFTPGTGGLVLDRDFMESRALALQPETRLSLRKEVLGSLGRANSPISPPERAEEGFWFSVFTYERCFDTLVSDLAAAKNFLPSPLVVLAAAGKSQACLNAAWEKAGRPFALLQLPFLAQEAWDRTLLCCDFSLVRGEDSWARAALSGQPFLWQAYPQAQRYQLVKVRAFIERLRPLFPIEAFNLLSEAFLAINDRDADHAQAAGDERFLPLLEQYGALRPGFRRLGEELAGGPSLAAAIAACLRDFR